MDDPFFIIWLAVAMVALIVVSALRANRADPPKHWVEYAVLNEGHFMPMWMMELVHTVCNEQKVKTPSTLSVRYVPQLAGKFLGGYTRYIEGGEICVVYGPRSLGNHFMDMEERETILHEVAHWIMAEGEGDLKDGGHTPRFYSKLMELCLMHGVGIEYMVQNEYNYMGSKVFEGISLFDRTYNE